MAKTPYTPISSAPGGMRGGMYDRQEMRQTAGPPVAYGPMDVLTNALVSVPRKMAYEQAVLDAVSSYIASENTSKPYLDSQVLDYLVDSGIEDLTRKDIGIIRRQLGIERPSRRR